MSTSNLVLLAGVALAGTTLAKQSLQRGKAHPSALRTILAALAVMLFLSFVAAAAENIARPLAWLVIAGAVLGNGQALLSYIGKLGK